MWRYAWDAHDRPVRCETPSGEVWVYGYDPIGRRVSKRRELGAAEEVWVRGRFPGLVQSVAAGGRSGLDVWAARPAGASDLDGRPLVVGVAYLWDGDGDGVAGGAAAARLRGRRSSPQSFPVNVAANGRSATTNAAIANLTAFCQRCHMNHDRPEYQRRRRRTLFRRKALGDLFKGPYPNA